MGRRVRMDGETDSLYVLEEDAVVHDLIDGAYDDVRHGFENGHHLSMICSEERESTIISLPMDIY